MSLNAREFVARERSIRAALEESAALEDQDAEILALVRAATPLLSDLTALAEDDQYWASVADAVGRMDTREILNVLMGTDVAAVLESLGYTPPPPALDFVDEAIESVIVDPGLSSASRVQRVEDARIALFALNRRLASLLEDRGLLPRRGRLALLRSAMRRGSRILVLVAPTIVAFGAQALGVAVLPADITVTIAGAVYTGASKEVLEKLAPPLAEALCGQIESWLPEQRAETMGDREILASIDPTIRVRTLATVVSGRLRLLVWDTRAAADLASDRAGHEQIRSEASQTPTVLASLRRTMAAASARMFVPEALKDEVDRLGASLAAECLDAEQAADAAATAFDVWQDSILPALAALETLDDHEARVQAEAEAQAAAQIEAERAAEAAARAAHQKAEDQAAADAADAARANVVQQTRYM